MADTLDAKWSDEAARRLGYLACLVALEAPAKQGTYNVNASIRWSLVHEIRDAMVAHGFDLKTGLARVAADRKAGRK